MAPGWTQPWLFRGGGCGGALKQRHTVRLHMFLLIRIIRGSKTGSGWWDVEMVSSWTFLYTKKSLRMHQRIVRMQCCINLLRRDPMSGKPNCSDLCYPAATFGDERLPTEVRIIESDGVLGVSDHMDLGAIFFCQQRIRMEPNLSYPTLVM